ncbi:MAG: Ldh family oxidoreductase, partial [bacterium]
LQSGSFMKALTGMQDGHKIPIPIGHFFLAMDVEAFIDLAEFKKNTGDILRALRASKKAPGQKRIYTAGEKEYLVSIERKKTGIPLPPSVQIDLVTMRDELGLSQYRFAFEPRPRAKLQQRGKSKTV